MKTKAIFVIGAFLLLAMPFLAVAVSAQSTSSQQSTNNNPNSLRISPVRTDVAVDPGSSKQVKVYAQNLNPVAVQAKAVVSDFEASRDESGQPLVLMDDAYAKSHSLKRLSTVSPEIVSLAPNERKEVTLTINVPKDVNAGGYYGIVRFLPATDLEQDENGVAISTNVGSLVLLKVNGETEEKLTLASMDVRQNGKAGGFFKTNKGIKAVVRFNNEGNIQLQPFGKIQIKDRSGKVVEEIEVNNTSPRGSVLPDSIRKFEVDLKKIGKFGRYTVEGNFSYSSGEILTSTTKFWVVPTTYIIGGVIGLLALGGIGFLIYKVIALSRRGRGVSRRY